MSYPESWRCPNCRKLVKNNKICPNCHFKYSKHYPDLWHCPNCNTLVYDSRRCPKCSYPDNLHYPDLWHCPECQHLNHSTEKCIECGYIPNFDEVSKKITPVERKRILSFRKKEISYVVGAITLIGILLLIAFKPSPNEFTVSNPIAGSETNITLRTDLAAQSVTFELISPSGETYTLNASYSKNGWLLNNLVLNESGTWTAVARIRNYGAITDITKVFSVQSSCSNDYDCDIGLCCKGACFQPCVEDSDCDDGNNYTVDICNNKNTCSAKCIHAEPKCSFISDGYCPSNCNAENDADCTNCPEGKILCGATCHKPCQIDSDCDDGSDATIDRCMSSTDPCSSYCVNILKGDIQCPTGKINVDGECITPECSTNKDCYKEGNYGYYCDNPGTKDAKCVVWECPKDAISCDGRCMVPLCSSNADCDQGDRSKFYFCINPGQCDAYCTSQCAQGYTEIDGKCVATCSNYADCAIKFEEVSYDDIAFCKSIDEGEGYDECVKAVVESKGGDTRFFCNNGLCQRYECLSNSDCDDNNVCTKDYCSNYKCVNEPVSYGEVSTDGNFICCNTKPVPKDLSSCNIPTVSYDVDSTVPTIDGDYTIKEEDTNRYIESTSNTIKINLIESSGREDIYVTFRFKSDNNPIVIFNPEDADSVIQIHTYGSVWQTYSFNGTTIKGNQILEITGNGGTIAIDDINVYLGKGNPYKFVPNDNDHCKSKCEVVNECINDDGVCPVGCYHETDNDCEVCNPEDKKVFYNGACVDESEIITEPPNLEE